MCNAPTAVVRESSPAAPMPMASAGGPAAAGAGAGSVPPVGTAVRLLQTPPFLKTADPMPMLRPPDLVDSGEVGQVVALRALEQVAVRFRRGTFLLEARQLQVITPDAAD